MKDYEDEAFDELEKAQQRKVATGVTDGSNAEANITLSALKLALEFIERTSTYLPLSFDAEGIKIHAMLKEALAKEPAPISFYDGQGNLKAHFNADEPVNLQYMPAPALASVQEPVAYRYKMPVEDDYWVWNYCTYPDNRDDPRCEPLYTTPPTAQPAKQEPVACPDCGCHFIPAYPLGAAIEQEQSDPVAKYIGECSEGSLVQLYDDVKKGTDFYTTPQQRPTLLTYALLHLFQEWKEDHLSQSNYIDAVEQIKAAYGIKGQQ